MEPWAYVVAGALGGWMALVAIRRLERVVGRLRARRRMTRARRGEMAAERLLTRHGFQVIDRQPELSWNLATSAGPVRVDLRADLLVNRRGKRYVAEVKTGSSAPSLTSAGTRRQLLEYATAYDVDGALLVDPEASRITEVFFSGRRSPWVSWCVVAVAIAAALGWLLSAL